MTGAVLAAALTLLAVGDSITAIGDPPFAALPGYNLVNLGAPRATTADWIRQGRPDCEPAYCGALRQLDGVRPPDVIHVMLGANDAIGGGRWDPPATTEQYAKRLTLLVTLLQKRWPEARILVSTTTQQAGALRPADYRLDSYRQAVHDVVEQRGVEFGVDFYALVPLAEMDPVHPRQEGLDRMRLLLQKRLAALPAREPPEQPSTGAP